MTAEIQLSRAVAQRVLSIVDKGLTNGLGKPEAGSMCVEAAVCFALGLPHGDNPPCVGAAVRAFKIKLNDSRWSSDQARAEGMRALAIAQLGSNKIDQNEFRKEVVVGTVRKILPIALRAAAKMVPAHAAALEVAAVACEALKSFAEAKATALGAKKAANAAANAAADAAYAAANAYAYAADAAIAAVDAAYAAAYANAAADAAAANAAADAAYAAANAANRPKIRDGVLRIAAQIGLDALIKLGSEGTQWLDLCENSGSLMSAAPSPSTKAPAK